VDYYREDGSGEECGDGPVATGSGSQVQQACAPL